MESGEIVGFWWKVGKLLVFGGKWGNCWFLVESGEIVSFWVNSGKIV